MAYIETQGLNQAGRKFVMKEFYRTLAAKFRRSEKAFEYRMQNISYVLSLMGSQIAARIQSIYEAEIGIHYSRSVAFDIEVKGELGKPAGQVPAGVSKPAKSEKLVTQYSRDSKVKAWVLRQAGSTCGCCQKEAPFYSADDGLPFFEVHHLRPLAENGTDTVSNAVAVCPNCHRELHYGSRRKEILGDLYSRIKRLVRQ